MWFHLHKIQTPPHPTCGTPLQSSSQVVTGSDGKEISGFPSWSGWWLQVCVHILKVKEAVNL